MLNFSNNIFDESAIAKPLAEQCKCKVAHSLLVVMKVTRTF